MLGMVAIVLAGLALAPVLALIWLARIMFDVARGYRVSFQGRAGIVYSDKRGVVFVDGEMLGISSKSYVIYVSKMRLMKARQQHQIDERWREEIIDRIERAVGRGKLKVAD